MWGTQKDGGNRHPQMFLLGDDQFDVPRPLNTWIIVVNMGTYLENEHPAIFTMNGN